MRVEYGEPMVRLDCDGCDYTIAAAKEGGAVRVEKDASVLRVPWPGSDLEFHFHSPKVSRNDCFRYWAHNPRIMRRSLERRSLSEAVIDDFLSAMLYRDNPSGPGVAREKP